VTRLSSWLAAGAATAVLALAGCNAHGGVGVPAVGNPQMQVPASVATKLALVSNSGDKTGYHLQLSIAGTTTRGFLFDTGSGGLWVFANTLSHPQKPVRNLHIPTTNTYGSGLKYVGEAVETTVDFGAGFPTVKVPLVRVTNAYCVTKSCKKKFGDGNVIDAVEKERGLWGTFGADLEPKQIARGTRRADLYNVLFALGSAWTSFAVAPGELDASPSWSGFTVLQLQRGPSTYKPLPNGAKSWQRDAQACFKIDDGAELYSQCLPTLFDTGASGVSFRTSAAGKLPSQETTQCGLVLKAGTSFVAQTPSQKLLASFKSGTTQNWNEVRLETPGPTKSPQVNTGLTFYNRNEIAFDAVRGSVGLRRLVPPKHYFESDCQATGPSLAPTSSSS
jgi:hypothetical protein